jgi:hypothetical protein
VRRVAVVVALASALCWTPASGQALLDALKDAVTGPPTRADVAAALTVSGTRFFVDSELN